MSNETSPVKPLHKRAPSTQSQSNGAAKPPPAPLQGLLDDDGPSMFDEANAKDPTSPQSLSAAPLPVLKEVIDHHGATELIKRLSAALAERDAHITALTRLAQEYNVPHERIAETASRVKRAERRRLSLAAAAAENVTASSAVVDDDGDLHSLPLLQDRAGVINRATRLFGGGGKRRESNVLKPTPSSSRVSVSSPRLRTARPQSIDAQSVASIQTTTSAEGNGWTTAIFGNASFPKRTDSLATEHNRMPVEMTTRHDKAQLPPTLSNTQPESDPQEADWNAYLVKLIESRQRNGEDVSYGELIGASHFGREGTEGRKKLEQLSKLVVHGIPMKLRHALWMELSHTPSIMKPDAYSYYRSLKESEDGTEIDAILKDVPRTLTSKYDFYSGKGFKRLKEVLFAFVGRYPHLGYTQGLNTIAGYLLLAIPSEEDAFWVLCNIVENYFPADYFARLDAMASPLADNILLREFVKELLPPQLSEHMDKLKIAAPHTAPIKWFFTAFSNALPETTAMRLWDVWLCVPRQKEFLFAFALALLSQNLDGILACEDDAAYFSFLDGRLVIPEQGEEITETIKVALRIGKKLEGISERRAEMKERMGLENRLQRRKTGSLEVLVDREEGGAAAAPSAAVDAAAPE